MVLRGPLRWLEREAPGSGLGAHVDRLRASVRQRIVATFAPAAQGMARALVLGESDLGEADEDAFRRSGLAHLLAVSGTHLVFAVLGVLGALDALLRRWPALAMRGDVRRLGAAVGLVLAPLYADFSGGSGSAWRAAFMLLGVLGARVLGRHVFGSRVLGLSLGLGWACDGLVVFDPSFLLSLAATSGLLLAGGQVARRAGASAAELSELSEPRRVELRRLLEHVGVAASASLAASLPCLPLILLLGPGVSLASVAANLLAGPLGELVALPLCLTHAIAWPFPALERGLALVGSGALLTMRELAHWTAQVDWLFVELPPPGRWHVLAAVLAAAGPLGLRAQAWLAAPASPRRIPARWLGAWLVSALGGLGLVEHAVTREHSAAQGRALQRLRVTALDVGQGDATLIDLPDGGLMLLDAGGLGPAGDPGARVILPVLRARRRAHLDSVVLSHPHPDHFGGLAALAASESVSIGELWYAAGPAPPDGELGVLLARLSRRARRVREAAELCRTGTISAGAVIEVLAPCPDLSPELSANDNSLVLRLRWGARAALLLGDAERAAEARLLGRPRELRADFLKVGHHGSRSSSTAELIARVQPALASISCGKGNRFGHPHAETLATLAAAGVLPLRSDRLGSVEWQSDGSSSRFRVFDERALALCCPDASHRRDPGWW
jgi:competence protein ComEC